MYPSCEVRWFFSETPDGLMDWFASEGRRFDEPENTKRTDHYLLVDNGRNIGVKLREGNIEAKHLVKSLGEWYFPEINAKGVVENWIKWSFKLDEADGLSSQIIQEGNDHWVAVVKERLGYTYHFLENGAVREVPIHKRVLEGCQVELTRIEVNNLIYYTFSLEAFSSSGQLEKNLKLGVTTAFSTLQQWCGKNRQPMGDLGFREDESMSYPFFLLQQLKL